MYPDEEQRSRTPCAQPIDNLDELIQWRPTDDYYVGVAALAPSSRITSHSKTLFCHDMAGGYLEDRFVQGSSHYDAYRFYHWHLVDTFVYFSHHMITIPPPCWINAAHKHGVPVLGTFITEWEDGKKKCEQLLSNRELMDQVINKMVDLALHHSMDGWLINIENTIDKSLVRNLASFVKKLTERMHTANPESQVIWYDSVTLDGELEWQNELNDNNSLFFDACDAIFLNYTWNMENLVESAKNAIGRLKDVYVGIDVFGRGMIGGGGYNTKEALALARKAQLSVALFAPGWVYEVNGSRDFDANEESVFRFWYYLQPYLPMHVTCELPISSSFCQGWGQKVYIDGKVVSMEPWSNLSMQQLQPTLNHSELGHNPHQQYKWLHLQDGFYGGGAMRFIGRLPATGQTLSYKIFDHAVPMDTSVFVCYTMKRQSMEIGAKFYLYLTLNKGEDNERRILLPEEELESATVQYADNDTLVNCLAPDDVPYSLRKSNVGRENGTWKNRVFLLDEELLKEKTLDEVGLLACSENTETLMIDTLIGNIQVIEITDPTLHPQPVMHVSSQEVLIDPIEEHAKLPSSSYHYSLSMRLEWEIPNKNVSAYNVWYTDESGENKWLGCTYSNKYFISDFLLDNRHGDIDFTVQVLYQSGIMEELKQATKYSFNY